MKSASRTVLARCGLIVTVALLDASSAAADEAPIIVVLESPSPTASARETSTRARAELNAAGFQVVMKPAQGSDTRAALESALVDAGAIAAIAIESDPSSTVAQVWVSDRLTGKLSIRPVETRGMSDTPALLAIRSVELLRASLIELRNPSSIQARPKPLPDAVAKLTEPPPRSESGSDRSPRAGFGIELGLAGLLNVDPANPALAPVARLSYGSKIGVGARLTWIGPSVGPGIPGTLGKASLTQELAIGEVVFAPPLRSPLLLQVSSGLGVYHVSATGNLRDARQSKSGGEAAFVATVGGGGGARLGEHFTVGMELFAAFTAPNVVIDMGAQRVGSVGRPILGLTTGIGAFF